MIINGKYIIGTEPVVKNGTIGIFAGDDDQVYIKLSNGSIFPISSVYGTGGIVIGPQGTQGPQGLQGLQGLTGSQGLQGLQGLTGSQGLQGLQGLTGSQGFQGLQGLTGSQGFQGLQGLTGSQGLQGLQGLTGSQGFQGLQGLTGSQGFQGLQGLTGSQGFQGPAATGSSVYSGISPTNITVGGLLSGTNIFGMTISSIIELMTQTYYMPSFTAFSVSNIPTEVGVSFPISPSSPNSFTWNTAYPSNIIPNSITLELTSPASEVLSVSNNNDGSENLYLTSPNFINNIPKTWTFRISATSSNSTLFNRTFSGSSIYPYFYGKVSAPGNAGDNRPIANQALINSGSKSVSSSTSTITISFNSVASDYIWFAIPSTSTSKTSWYVDALNTGSIGGLVSAGGNLFPTFDTVVINSPTSLWSGISYKVYISNYQTLSSSPMQLRN
jgi:hypothetical protein